MRLTPKQLAEIRENLEIYNPDDPDSIGRCTKLLDHITALEAENKQHVRVNLNAGKRITALDAEKAALSVLPDRWRKNYGTYAEVSEKYARELESVIGSQNNLLVYMYNMGYGQGHNDTVESCYTDVFPVDAHTYHSDIVNDILDTLLKQEQE